MDLPGVVHAGVTLEAFIRSIKESMMSKRMDYAKAAPRLKLPALVGYLLAGVLIGPARRASWPTWRSPPSWPRSA
jgi:hypothetical protein